MAQDDRPRQTETTRARRSVVLWAVVLWTLATAVHAQGHFTDRYLMTQLDLAEGLPHSNVNHIFADSRGFVWVSTYGGGAVRYDGYSFLSPRQSGVQRVTSTACKGFAEDGHERLWIAYDEHTTVLDLHTMQAVVPRWKGRDIGRLLRKHAVRVYCDTKGAIWHVTTDSIYRYTFDKAGDVTHIAACRYENNVPDIMVSDVEGNGSAWCSIDGGLYRLTDNGRRLVRTVITPAMQQLGGLYITDLLKQDHTVWIATNQGLWAHNLYDATLTRYLHAADNDASLSSDFTTSLAVSSDGRLLVGTLSGIDIMHLQHHTFEHWNSNTAGRPLPSDFVHCLTMHNGQLWIGTETAGIVKLSPQPLMLTNYTHERGRDSSLSPHPVNAIYADRQGTLWVGTVEGGLNRKTAGNAFEHLTTRNSALSHNSVSVLLPDGNDNLWIGTWGGGLNVLPLAGADRQIRPVTHLPADQQLAISHIGSLAYDRYNDLLWVGSNEGIFIYDTKSGTLQQPFPGNREIRGSIGALVDKKGQLWMGCMTGACIIDLPRGRNRQGHFSVRRLRNKLDRPDVEIQDKISCFCQTRDGTLWLGSGSYGIYRRVVDKQTGKERFEGLSTDDGLANNAVKGMVEDTQGRLWITTANGLSVYDPRSRTFINYGTADGLVSQCFYYNSAVKGADGAIYLGTTDGLTEVRGENPNSQPVHLTFTQLTVDNQTVTAANSDMLDADIAEATRIRLHESVRSLDISFSALVYSGEAQGHYSYRLSGFEQDWTMLKPGEHSVRYTGLQPGKYTLEVSYTAAGEEQSDHIAIDIDVAPYFWKSWWFRLLLLAGVAAIVYALHRRQLERWKQQETERLLKPIKEAISQSDAPEQMQTHITNILSNRKRMKQSIHRSVEADKEDTKQHHKTFIERATDILEKNYTNSDFGIDDFALAIGMSKSLLSKRLNEETGMSTGQFIRNYRLTIARRLLLENESERNITEIAYHVGFNDPKYFTRCFTRRYGVAPSGYKEADNNEGQTGG